MYLREMGTVPLLDREGEVEIAQRIEQGEWLIYEALCENPVVLRELLRLNEMATKDKRILRELVAADPDEPLDPKAADRIKGNLKIFEQIAANDHGDRRAAQAPEALQAGRREVPGDRARDRPPGRQDRQGHPHGRLQRPDPQPAGRLPQGHRQAVLPLRAGHQAGADGAQARDQRGAQGPPPPPDREVPRQPAGAGGALRHHPRRDRGDDQQDPARARRAASGPRKS